MTSSVTDLQSSWTGSPKPKRDLRTQRGKSKTELLADLERLLGESSTSAEYWGEAEESDDKEGNGDEVAVRGRQDRLNPDVSTSKDQLLMRAMEHLFVDPVMRGWIPLPISFLAFAGLSRTEKPTQL